MTSLQQAAALWHEGLSFGKIGKELGVSKNTIAGWAHRNRHLFPFRDPSKAHRVAKPKPARPIMEPERLIQNEIRYGKLGCQYLEGDVAREKVKVKAASGGLWKVKPATKGYESWADVPRCTEARMEGSPYCQKHHHLCYQKSHAALPKP